MPKLKTVTAVFDGSVKYELKFKYDVYITQDGVFTTTLPIDIATTFSNAGFYMYPNQLGNIGFFKAKTFDELVAKVAQVAQDYLSKALIEEIVVIRYDITTTCSYWKNEDGTIQPNGYGGKGGGWKEGTLSQHAAARRPFGILIYACPYVRRKYKYRTGKEKTDYIKLCYAKQSEMTGKDFVFSATLKELDSFPSIAPNCNDDKLQDIPYTQSVCQFFLNMLYSMCNLNEKIKDFLTPDAIQMLADKKMNFLGNGEDK